MKRKSLAQGLVLLTGTLLCCVIILEIGVRLIGEYNADGNFRIFGRSVKPYFLPLQVFLKNAADYSRSSQTRIIYDDHLGWSPRPGIISKDGLYYYNSLGIRVSSDQPVEYDERPGAGVLRIILIGDSYSHGEEVRYESSLGYLLETQLCKAGVATEVINLALGGYGIDQALLRWRQIGRGLHADIVLLGLQFENVIRNVNIIRSLYLPDSGLPFTKPRYLLQNNQLQILNSPTLQAPEVIDVLSSATQEWQLAKYEHFLGRDYYQKSYFYQSKLIAILSELLFPIEADSYFYDLDEEPAKLTLELLKQYQAEISASGSQFMLVHIPIILDLLKARFGLSLNYSDLLMEIEKNHVVCQPMDELLKHAGTTSLTSLYQKGGHYSSTGNEVIAKVIAKDIVEGHLR